VITTADESTSGLFPEVAPRKPFAATSIPLDLSRRRVFVDLITREKAYRAWIYFGSPGGKQKKTLPAPAEMAICPLKEAVPSSNQDRDGNCRPSVPNTPTGGTFHHRD